ncbi:MAG: winged helix-turn-helix transcriptional regulator [Pirellulales bacterium]|nr:winged helix-turn-helix transcriptional regulator [Pirellulales bacterium]
MEPAAACGTEPALAAAPQRSASAGKANRRLTAGRFDVLNTFVDETLGGLCRGDVAVWLILYRDTRDGTARTSQADIGRRAGLSVRGAAKALRRLEQRGLLKTIFRGGLNRGASRYRVLPRPDT